MFMHTAHRAGDAVCLHVAGELIDCAAVATLLGLRAAAAAAGTCLVLTHQHGVVRQVLQLLDLVDVFSEQLTGHAAAILTGCRDAQPTVL